MTRQITFEVHDAIENDKLMLAELALKAIQKQKQPIDVFEYIFGKNLLSL